MAYKKSVLFCGPQNTLKYISGRGSDQDPAGELTTLSRLIRHYDAHKTDAVTSL